MHREKRCRNFGNVSNSKRCENAPFFNKFLISNATELYNTSFWSELPTDSHKII